MIDLFGDDEGWEKCDSFNTATVATTKDEWLTPPHIIAALGKFDLDPCAPRVRPWDMATRHFTIEDNGLFKPWEGRVWLNPPYGKETFRWIARLSEHKRGIALLFARTETKGFHKHIFSKASSVFFFDGRIKFHHVDGKAGGTAKAPSCLVSYSEDDDNAIRQSGLGGRLVIL